MPTTIDTVDITEGKLNGNGSFDKLIASTKEHLKEEYSEQRISGPDYANVYLGALTTVLQQSMTFELQRHAAAKQADLLDAQLLKLNIELETDEELRAKQLAKLDAEIAILVQQELLTAQQVLQATKNNTLLDTEILKSEKDLIVVTERAKAAPYETIKIQHEADIMAIQFTNTGKQGELLDEQVSLAVEQVKAAPFETQKVIEEAKYIENQANNELIKGDLLRSEDAVLKEKVIAAPYETEKTKSEAALLDSQALNVAKEGAILDSRIDIEAEKLVAAPYETDKVQQEALILAGKAINTDKEGVLLTSNNAKILKDTEATAEQIVKIQEEVDLLQQRTINAVKEGVVLDHTATKVTNESTLIKNKANSEEANYAENISGVGTVAGTIQRKNDLYAAQKDAFFRDAEQKAAKIYGDLVNTSVVSEDAVPQAIYGTILGDTSGLPGTSDYSKITEVYEYMALKAGINLAD